eukprot:TRINITY_DN4055_c0_g1_i1.p1 TRINITY_DN4055_c0_g1~~TRINITY_DN4055_c0_g1_i1.p1  ORF type:complete len:298 (+),score=51.28 TRINITY_DN4055_c0_g1_i1:158-1051(+)
MCIRDSINAEYGGAVGGTMDYFSGLASHLSDKLDAAFDTTFDTGVQELNDILRAEGNTVCADCVKPNPRWVHLGFASFLCTRCAGVHGMLAGDPHCVTSLRAASEKIHGSHIKALRNGGNNKCNQKRRKATGSHNRVESDDLSGACYLIAKKYGYSSGAEPAPAPAVCAPSPPAGPVDAGVQDLLVECEQTPTSALVDQFVENVPQNRQQAIMNAFHQMPAGSVMQSMPAAIMPTHQMQPQGQSNASMPALMPANFGNSSQLVAAPPSNLPAQHAQTGPGSMFYHAPSANPQMYSNV